MRRDRTVINPFAKCVSLSVWRNLADTVYTRGRVSADLSKPAIRLLDVEASGLLAQQRSAASPAGAQVGDRRQRQKAEAADRRVKQQRRRGWNRKRKGATDGNQAKCTGHQNQTCKHVLQPPREEHSQVASGAWQDCGRAWEFLRRINLTAAVLPGTVHVTACRRTGPGLQGRSCAVPGKRGRKDAPSFPEVTDDCLSFVTPRQQGAVAICEDVP